jgi:hypothetical protein
VYLMSKPLPVTLQLYIVDFLIGETKAGEGDIHEEKKGVAAVTNLIGDMYN